MAKAIRTAAFVVGAAAAIVATGGALGIPAFSALATSLGFATAAGLATGLGLISAGLSTLAAITAKVPGGSITGRSRFSLECGP